MIIFKKEKQVIELVIRHLDKVEETLETASKTIHAYLNSDIKKAKELAIKVDGLEAEADEKRHEIRDKLYSGAYLPVLREDIYRLVESIDKVANAAEASCDFFLDQRPAIPADLNQSFVLLTRESLGIIAPLKTAVLCFLKGECSIEIVRKSTTDVGMIESEVDKMEWDLTKAIFKSSLDYGHKIHLRNCVETLVEVSDRSEDAAGRLELTVLKSVS